MNTLTDTKFIYIPFSFRFIHSHTPSPPLLLLLLVKFFFLTFFDGGKNNNNSVWLQ
jgi:hypothetical protein